MKSIAEQVIVITGASSGIGLATAQEAARRGARVVLAARNASELDRAVDEIRRGGGVAVAVPTDVSDYAQVEALARRAADEFGGIDTWVNNAAVMLYATFRDTSLEDFRRVLDVNLMGQVHGAKAALPYLEASGGALICIGSIESERGVVFQSAYAASKHAVKGWLDAFRVELEKEGSKVRVTLINPASINTPIYDHTKTQTGSRPEAYPPIYAPELAAEAILYAAEHRVRELYVGGAAKLLAVAEAAFPRLVDQGLRLLAFRHPGSGPPKPADAPHNLYAPLPHEGGVRGSFTGRERRWSLYPWASEHPWALTLGAVAFLGLGALAARYAAARIRTSR